MQVRATIAQKMKERFDVITVPRSATCNVIPYKQLGICKHAISALMMVFLQATVYQPTD